MFTDNITNMFGSRDNKKGGGARDNNNNKKKTDALHVKTPLHVCVYFTCTSCELQVPFL